MAQTATEWNRPPVVEVVLGVQFAPLPRLHNGLLGLFWRDVRTAYPNASDAPPIPAVIDDFGTEPQFAIPGIELAPARGDSRLRMVTADGSRMIQIQNGWLIANWMKRPEQPYPGYGGVRVQFDEALAAFEQFAASNGLGRPQPSVWEVTYIDHIPRGTVWSSFADIPAVVPGLLGHCADASGGFEAFTGTWSYHLPGLGRLRIALQTARSSGDPAVDLLVVTTTARGPIIGADRAMLDRALNSGHEATVEKFRTITSSDAREYWEGRDV